MMALLFVILSVLEFLGFTWVMKYAVTGLFNGDITMYTCGALMIAVIWVGVIVNKFSGK